MLHTMQLMPIGRFSRLTGVGVKALRHYDEVGLLVPAAVDDETGYRFYSPDQVDRAAAIRLLRRLDMPLDEIRSTLAADDPAALRAALVSHQRQMASRDSDLRSSIAKLQRLIDGRETIMGMRSESLQADEHRRLGIDLYNRTWTLMDSPGDEMLHLARVLRRGVDQYVAVFARNRERDLALAEKHLALLAGICELQQAALSSHLERLDQIDDIHLRQISAHNSVR